MNVSRIAKQLLLWTTFRHSATYWESRYRSGLDSGSGSYGQLAQFKAEFLNGFVRDKAIKTVVEFGCGDGNQLSLAQYPLYLGLDVSKTAIDLCRVKFADDSSKAFLWYDPVHTINLSSFVQADLSISLDVLYHLVEDGVYRTYLRQLFATSRSFVIIYSSDAFQLRSAPHVRHREISHDIRLDFPQFRLLETVANRYPDHSPCSFFVYQRAE